MHQRPPRPAPEAPNTQLRSAATSVGVALALLVWQGLGREPLALPLAETLWLATLTAAGAAGALAHALRLHHEAPAPWAQLRARGRAFGERLAGLPLTSDRRAVVDRQKALLHLLRAELRGQDLHQDDDIRRLVPFSLRHALVGVPSPAAALITHQRRALDGLAGLTALERAALGALLDQQGLDVEAARLAAHRPLPGVRALRAALPLLAIVWPLGLIASSGLWTPLIAGLIAAFLGALADRASAFGDPFGDHPRAWPLLAWSREAENDLRAVAGEPPLAAITAVDGVLP